MKIFRAMVAMAALMMALSSALAQTSTRAYLASQANSDFSSCGNGCITGALLDTYFQSLVANVGVLNDANAWTGTNVFTVAPVLTVPLGIASGGTGDATLAANGVLYGAGANAVAVSAAGTTGQVLIGTTGSAPSWAALSGLAATSLSFGTTGLTPSTAAHGAITVAGTLAIANGGTGITSFGTGIAGALGANVGSAGAPALYGGVGLFASPLAVSASLPVITTCGTGTPAMTAGSSANAGQVTLGTGSPTACTLTFAAAFANVAFCTFTPASNYTGTYYVSAQSKSAMTLTLGTGTSGAVFNYTCGGN
jgi:hypothetical protein